jgi:SAM-dependent methyltransferase
MIGDRIRHLRWWLRSHLSPPTDKEEWEFVWQRDRWAPLFRTESVRATVHQYWREYRHLDEIVSAAEITSASTILDVGCGISTVLHYLPGQRYGLDPLLHLYQRLYEYPLDIKLVTGIAEQLPFGEGLFDLAICSNAIDHTSAPDRVVSEIRRVVRQQGHVVLTCEVFPENLGSRNAGHPHSLTEARLLDLASDFVLVRHWRSPWYGLERFARGRGPTDREEHILLLRRV